MDIKFDPPRGDVDSWAKKISEDLNIAFDLISKQNTSEFNEFVKKINLKYETLERKIKQIEGSSEFASLEDASGQSF